MKKIRREYLIEMVLVVVAILILVITLFVKHHNYFDYWFSSGMGNHFQWVGVSVLIAAIGVVISAFWSKVNFNTELFSKTKIEKMKLLRPVVSLYITSAQEGFGNSVNAVVARLRGEEADFISFLAKTNELKSFHAAKRTELMISLNKSSNDQMLSLAIDKFNEVYAAIEHRWSYYISLNPEELNKHFISEEVMNAEREKDNDAMNLYSTMIIKISQEYFDFEWALIEGREVVD